MGRKLNLGSKDKLVVDIHVDVLAPKVSTPSLLL